MKTFTHILASTAPLLGLISLLSSANASEETRPAKPNIVLIVSDDLGWQDLKCYDVDAPLAYDTPYLDAFAKRGVMFWQAYSPAPSCSPSRCAIVSGNHPARAQKTHVLGGKPPYASSSSRMVTPWFSGRMPEDTFTIARALDSNGYTTGHAGKWHIAIDHSAFPQPKDVGFDFTKSSRGAHSGRGLDNPLTGFATRDEKDPYRLDENGFPYHQNNEDALDFIKENKEDPFFLYYCTWLVHSPIVTRNEALLKKYAERMGVDPATRVGKNTKSKKPGQTNPFYGAMVESLDYYMGQVFEYLDKTDDPRWPGHKLSENTYVIFTSDNGGVVGYTDNTPLDKGKTSAKEGGTRVPLMIVGPNIQKGAQSDAMVNGLDFYPTIVSLTGTKLPAEKHLDGCDISPLLLGDPTDKSLIKLSDGSVREFMVWHFPHNNDYESTIINDGYKLIRNYDHVNNPSEPAIELFQLYKSENGKDVRVDIEEAKNLAKSMPEKTQDMDNQLTSMLTEMKASYPSYNPDYKGELPNQDLIPSISQVSEKGGTVTVTYKENGATIEQAQLIYTHNGGDKHEEWFKAPLTKVDETSFKIALPKETTHYFINLIDENKFLVSYPSLKKYSRKTSKMTDFALATKP
ncbi:sulfatase [Rubritalea sp.]|uniref:sulfatase n=1 Tax=Rubritalea sp. TaxID=2109375 RepID=UPI003EF16111